MTISKIKSKTNKRILSGGNFGLFLWIEPLQDHSQCITTLTEQQVGHPHNTDSGISTHSSGICKRFCIGLMLFTTSVYMDLIWNFNYIFWVYTRVVASDLWKDQGKHKEPPLTVHSHVVVFVKSWKTECAPVPWLSDGNLNSCNMKVWGATIYLSCSMCNQYDPCEYISTEYLQ